MEIKIGDEVRVVGSRRGPDGGHRATVTKVGRKFGTATFETEITAYPPRRSVETIEFDLATGAERNGSRYGTGGPRVRTLEQVALDERLGVANKALFTAGVSITYPSRLTLEQVEALAEVARTLPALDRGRL